MSSDSIPLDLSLTSWAKSSPETAEIFSELRRPLQRYLVGLGLGRDEAEDVVQDSFLALHQHLRDGGSTESIRSWVFRVAHNRARNFQQSYASRMGEPLDPAREFASRSLSPEDAVLEQERQRQFQAAVRSLAPAEYQCLMLRAEGLRYREIGEVLTMSTSTVADTVERAVRKLAERCHV